LQQREAAADQSEDEGVVDKRNRPYLDIVGAWGPANTSYLSTVSFLSLYLHDRGDLVGLHARALAPGMLTFERSRVSVDATPSRDRKYAFVMELIDPSVRFYAGPFFLAAGFDFGLTFYDGLVPTLDGQTGVGFEYAGWGLEGGVRSSRLPRKVTVLDGREFVYTKYGAQIYLAVETNIPF